MSYPARSSPFRPYGDENYQPFSPPTGAPNTANPQSHYQHYHYPPSQPHPQLYSSGLDWAYQLDPSAYLGASRSGNMQTAANPTTSALIDRTHAVTNTTQSQAGRLAAQSRPKRKRGLLEAERQTKRRSLAQPQVTHLPIPAAHGIGPIDPTCATPLVPPQPALTHTRGPSLGSLTGSQAGSGNGKSLVASDVWYFMTGVESEIVGPWPDKRPVCLPMAEDLKLRLSKDRPSPAKYKHFCCRLCRYVYYLPCP